MKRGNHPVGAGRIGSFTVFKPKLFGSSCLIGAAFFATQPSPAFANDPCTLSLSTLTCVGDQYGGITASSSGKVSTLNVNSLTKNIEPALGTFGIHFSGDGADGPPLTSGISGDSIVLNIEAPGRVIKTNLVGFSVFAHSVGGDGGQGGVDVFFGYSQGLIGRFARAGGRVTVTSNIDINSGHGIGMIGYSGGGTGGRGGDAGHAFKATGGDGSNGATGGQAAVTNSGLIETSGNFGWGVVAYSQGGHGGAGGNGGAIAGYGGDGGNAMAAGTSRATNKGTIETSGLGALGLVSLSIGGDGGAGGNGYGFGGVGGDGGFGSFGGYAFANNNGSIHTTGVAGHAIVGQSMGGVGGVGGTGAGLAGLPGDGAGTGNGGKVSIGQDGTVLTEGAHAYGVLAQSIGGFGGSGGSGGGIYADGGGGAAGGDGGIVEIKASGTTTTQGVAAHGLVGQSIGGGGGAAGDAGGVVALGGSGGGGGDGGKVAVINSGLINTSNVGARGIVAQSIGGGGGLGGSSGGAVAIGGTGSAASSGGLVIVNNNVGGNIVTGGIGSHGIFAESVGGGGGSAGDSGGLVALGGGGAGGGGGGDVWVINRATIRTTRNDSKGIFAQSVGGGGGEAGASGAGLVSLGGTGAGGGDGGGILVSNFSGGDLTTFGIASYGIFAQSVGGGGGAGGASGGLVSLGGTGAGGGAGGSVSVTSNSSISTYGHVGRGIFAQSVGGGGGDGGASGGFVSLGGHSTTSSDAGAISVTNYSGAITTRGFHADAILAQSVGGGGGAMGDSGGVVSIGGDGAGGGNGGIVTVTNGGALETRGFGARGVLAQSVGGGGGSGGSSGGLVSVGGRGSSTGNGGAVTLNNSGTVSTQKQFSEALLAQSVGGGGGIGGASGGWFSFGGSGGSGGDGDVVTVTNSNDLITKGHDSDAIFAQSIGGGGGSGGSTGAVGYLVSVAVGGGGGLGGNGDAVTIDSTSGALSTVGDRSNGITAQSVGGSGGNGGYAVSVSLNILGAVAVGVGGDAGGGGAGGAVDVSSGSTIETHGQGSLGILAQSVGGSGGNGGYAIGVAVGGALPGVSVGVGGSGGAAGDSGGTVTVNLTGGSIDTDGDRSTGVLAQSIGGGGGNGGFVITSAVGSPIGGAISIGGAGGIGRTGGVVSVISVSSVTTLGEDANAITAQSVGGGGGNGGYSIATSVNGGGGSLTIGGGAGSGNAGGNVNLNNSGTISTGGDRSIGLLAQSVGGGGGSGGYSISGSASATAGLNLSFGGAGGDGGNSGVTDLDNSATISTIGNDAHGISAQSLGGGGGSGGFSVKGSISGNIDVGVSVGGAGGNAAQAALVDVNNTGSQITTSGVRSYGLIAQSIGGSGGEGGFSVSGGAAFLASASVAVGGTGGAGGQSGPVTVTNEASIATSGVDSHGLFVQSIGGGGGAAGFGAAGSVSSIFGAIVGVGGKGGVGGTVNGTVNVTQSGGTINTSGDRSIGMLVQSIGGQGGDGGMSIAGNVATSGLSIGVGGQGGFGGHSGAVVITNYSDFHTTKVLSHGIVVQSVGGSGGTGGMAIKGSVTSGVDIGVAIGGKGGQGGVADSVTINDWGDLIKTDGDASVAVMGQSIGGAGGNGGLTIGGGVGGISNMNVVIGGAGGRGAVGGNVEVIVRSDVSTAGAASAGVLSQSIGGGGGNGGTAIAASVTISPIYNVPAASMNVAVGGGGGAGGVAGDATTETYGTVSTVGVSSFGVAAQSIGGSGGNGGMSVAGALNVGGQDSVSINVAVGGAGGKGGRAGAVTANTHGDVSTTGIGSFGVVAQSIGGSGGNGGMATSGALNLSKRDNISLNVAVGGSGGNSGNSGAVIVTSNAPSLSTTGVMAYGIVAQSIGGSGGNGGMAINGLLAGVAKGQGQSLNVGVAVGGPGGNGARSGAVEVYSNGDTLTTSGAFAYGILAQSIGGSGGSSGSNYDESYGYLRGDGDSYGFNLGVGTQGGVAAVASTVKVDNYAAITTGGSDAHGIVGQSIGGSGGTGALTVGLGGSAFMADVGLEIGARGPLGQAGAGGSANEVTINSLGAMLTTTGDRAYGVLAQSIGGTGGNAGADTIPFDYLPGIPGDAISMSVSVGGRGGAGGTGAAVFVTNDAVVDTTGHSAHGLVAQSLGGGGGAGGGLINGNTSLGDISATVGGPGGLGATSGHTTVTNNGSLTTRGSRSYGVLAQSIGGTGGEGGLVLSNGIAGGTLKMAIGGDGGDAGLSDTVTLENTADVTTYGASSHGLVAQSLGGGGGVGGTVIQGAVSAGPSLNVGIGGNGGNGATSGLIDVDSLGGLITTNGENAHGVLAQSIAGTGGDGSFSVSGSMALMPSLNVALGGNGGTSSVAGDVNVYVTSSITTNEQGSHGVMAQSIGGGGGSSGFAVAGGISGTGQISVGVGGSGGTGSVGGRVDVVTEEGTIHTIGNMSYGVVGQSIGGTGGAGSFGAAGGLSGFSSFAAGLGGSGGGSSAGGDVFVTNASAVQTDGNASYGLVAQSIGGGGGLGGYAFGVAFSVVPTFMNYSTGGTGGVGSSGGDVTLTNDGAVHTLGTSAHAILTQSIGGGGGATGFGDGTTPGSDVGWILSNSIGGAGIVEGDGGGVSVFNHVSVLTEGNAAHGIYAQSIGGGGGEGGAAFAATENPWEEMSIIVGGTGGVKGDGGRILIYHSGTITTLGSASMGIVAQSIGGGGGSGGASAFGSSGEIALGGSDGAFGHGGRISAIYSGDIYTFGASGIGVLAQSIGGGGGIAGNLDMGLPLGKVDLFGTTEVGRIGVGTSFARSGNKGGNGAEVKVLGSGLIVTDGIGAHGILAQSVGGGGGLAGTDGTDANGDPMTTQACITEDCQFLIGSVGGDGAAGNVVIDLTAGGIRTYGEMAHGLIAQSVAGATTGGIIDTSGDVKINLVTDTEQNFVAAKGAGSTGIFAQSLGADGSGNITITIGEDWHVVGGIEHGIGVQMRDGASNHLVNYGAISTFGELDGIAVYGGSGDETIDNYFYMMGMIGLGSGQNAINNMATGWYDMGATIDLGGGLLTNAGMLAPGGASFTGTSFIDGDLLQTASGHISIDWDYYASTADLLSVDGTADLAGSLALNVMYQGDGAPGIEEVTVITAAEGMTNSGMQLVMPVSAVVSYELLFPNLNDALVRRTLNFATEELSGNQSLVGGALNEIQTEGGFEGFEEVIQAIMTIGDDEALADAYEMLGTEVYGETTVLGILNAIEFSRGLMSCKSKDGDYRFIRQSNCRWARVEGSQAKGATTRAADGMKETNYRVAAGMQKRVSDNTHVGIGGSWSQSELLFGEQLRSEGDTYEAGVTLKHEVKGFLLSGAIASGVTMSDVERRLPFISDDTQVRGEHRSDYVSLALRANYVYGDKNFYIIPGIELGNHLVITQKVIEESASAAKLELLGRNEIFFNVQPSIEIGGEIESNNGTLIRPFLKAGWTDYFGETSSVINSRFLGAPQGVGSTMSEVELVSSQYNITSGFDLFMPGNGVLRIGYDGHFSDTVDRHGAFIKMAWPW